VKLSFLSAIKPNERLAVGYFFIVMLLFSFGASISRSVGMTLLIEHLGGQVLPHIFMLIDSLAMFAFFAYAHYSKRLPELKLLTFLFSISGLFIVLVWNLFSLDLKWIYGLFFIGFFLSYILITIQIATVTAAYFSSVQLKRITSFINTGLPIGGALGGASLLGLLQVVPDPGWLLSLTALAYFFALFFLKKINHHLTPVRSTHNRFSQGRSAMQELKSASSYILHSSLMSYMTIGMILFVIASKFMEYQYQAMIYPAMFPDVNDRARFFAVYELFGNLAWLFIQLFVASRLLPVLGVGASNLIHPILVVISALGLLFRFGFTTGVITHFVNQEMRGALRTPATNLLFNAVPPNMWGASKAFLNGIAFPVATIIASVSLIVLRDNLSQDDLKFYLALLTLILASLSILLAIPQWLAYNQGVFGLLHRHIFAGKNQLAKEKALISMVEQKLESDKSKEVIAALEMIRLLKVDDFVHTMGNLLLRNNRPENLAIKRYCIHTLMALKSSDDINDQISHALEHERNPQILAQLIQALDNTPHTNKTAIHHIESLLNHPTPEVFVASCLFLHHHPYYQHKTELEKRLLIRIHHPDLPGLEQYLYALGELGQSRYHNILEGFLKDPRDNVRFATFKAHIQLLEGQLDTHKHSFIEALNSPHKDMQLAALGALKDCSSLDDWQPLIQLLSHTDRAIVEQSRELLQQHIYRSKPALIQALFNSNVSVEQSFEILSLVYPLFDLQQQQIFQKKSLFMLKRYIYTQGLSLLFQQNEPEHSTHHLILKILHEIANEYLQRALVAITYYSRENREFFQRLSRGLQSDSKANQGNALEVLSNLNEKNLSPALIYYFDNQPQDMPRLEQVYQYLFEHKLPLSADNYRYHLFDIQHDLLRACLYYADAHYQEDRNNSSLRYESTSIKALFV